MNFDKISQRESALIRDYCVACNQPLKPNAAFCEHCGPPVLPVDSSKPNTTFGQAMKKIGVMTLIFAALVIYKSGWDYEEFLAESVQVFEEKKAEEVPQDEDMQLFHYVNVSHANIREKPDGKSKVIVGAGIGERLVVLEKGESWTQVEVGGKKGWIASRLLDATIE